MRAFAFCLLCTVTLFPAMAQAGWFGASFSADAVQNAPQQPPVTGKMYVGQGKMRTEMDVQGTTRVQIIDPEAGRMVMMMPQQRAYMEVPMPPSAPVPGGEQSASPCAGSKQLQCRREGEETVNGRPAVRWQLRGMRDGKQVEGVVWTDKQHGFPIKESVGGQVVSEMRFLGAEEHAGRSTEKWESVMAGPDGRKVSSLQWYDPELNIAIRQEMPGGFVRELRNIEVGAQPESLFRIPAGYSRVQGGPGMMKPPR